MTAGGNDGSDIVAGGPARHIPVLAPQVIDYLAVRDGGVYIDATFGAGGYSRAILAAADCRVIGIDRDRSAILGGAALVRESGGRLTLAEGPFSDIATIAESLAGGAVDGIAFDLGVSSMQLDQAERGFSFRFDGPLDMRMGGDGPNAADVVAHASERDLAAIIATLGEERFARAVARRITRERESQPIFTTRRLADIVGSVVRAKPHEIHPATRTFQALRMFVNDELGEIETALKASERILKPGGRLAVVTFHSLEDRIVKSFMTSRGKIAGVSRHMPEVEAPEPSFRLLTRKPLVADAAEIAANPRARSAKLRAAERTAVPALDETFAGVPNLPSLDAVVRAR